MNCDELLHRLADGARLDSAAQEHLANCPNCQEILAWASGAQAAGEKPDSQRLKRIQQQITGQWRPVKPIASNATLLISLLLLFLFLAAGATALTGPFGVRALHPLQMFVYYGGLALGTALTARVVVQLMVPGSKARFNPRFMIPAIAAMIVLVVVLLFPNFDSVFLHGGMRCFWTGIAAAAIAGLLFATLLRRMFPTAPVVAAATIGFFAGLCGVTVLALHCPVLVSTHILVWHFGVLILSTLSGAFIGYITEWVSQKNLLAYRNS
jgi:hypothetical protein